MLGTKCLLLMTITPPDWTTHTTASPVPYDTSRRCFIAVDELYVRLEQYGWGWIFQHYKLVKTAF